MEFFQSFCLAMGKKACYLFCIIKIACIYLGKQFIPSEVVDAVVKSIEAGYVDFNWNYYADDNNFWVNNPCGILKILTGKRWSVIKSYDVNYEPQEGEYIVSWLTIDDINGHFDIPQHNFKNYQFSNIATNGHVGSIRIFKCLGE